MEIRAIPHSPHHPSGVCASGDVVSPYLPIRIQMGIPLYALRMLCHLGIRQGSTYRPYLPKRLSNRYAHSSWFSGQGGRAEHCSNGSRGDTWVYLLPDSTKMGTLGESSVFRHPYVPTPTSSSFIPNYLHFSRLGRFFQRSGHACTREDASSRYAHIGPPSTSRSIQYRNHLLRQNAQWSHTTTPLDRLDLGYNPSMGRRSLRTPKLHDLPSINHHCRRSRDHRYVALLCATP